MRLHTLSLAARGPARIRVSPQRRTEDHAGLRDQLLQGAALNAAGAQVVGREPGLEAGGHRGPRFVGDRIPGGIAVAALDHHVLAEDALEAEAEALGGAPRRRVEGVAFPLQAAVAELVEGVG